MPDRTTTELIFFKPQKIVQEPGEQSSALHERLRPDAINSFDVLTKPTVVICQSWYAFDPSKILRDIENAVVICTSTCKHELPFRFIVGKKSDEWMEELGAGKYRYVVDALGRVLTREEKSAIYDAM